MKAQSALLSGLLVLAAANTQAQSSGWNLAPDLPPNPVLTLDQADYQPGEDAVISGTGFAPLEEVSLEVRHAGVLPGSGGEWSWNVAANEDGAITTIWHVCEDGCENTVLELKAVGQSSGRASVVTFSDGFIANGGFENDTLLGWSIVNSGQQQANWYRYSGTVSPISSMPIAGPPEGSYAMVTDQNGQGYEVLYQDLILEPGYSHKLSFKVYYSNRADNFYVRDDFVPSGNNQQYRVDLIRPATPILSLAPADLLGTLFRTMPGDTLELAPTLVTADLTPFAGSVVRVRFAVVQALHFFQASVDDVQLVSTPLRCLALECPADVVVPNDPGQCGAKVSFPAPAVLTGCNGQAGGNAEGVTVTCVPPSGSSFPLGTTLVQCTAKDAAGQSASCSFTVTVQDTEAPVITLAPARPLPVNPSAAEIAAAFGAASVLDSCSTELTAEGAVQLEEGAECARSVTKVWTARDAAGNIATVSQTIQFVRDTTAPVLENVSGPAAPVALGAAVTISASLRDDCSGIQQVSFDWSDGSEATVVSKPASSASGIHQYSRPGIYAVRVKARDAAGNQAEELFQYIVVYDASSGAVTGGGWIESRPGSCAAMRDISEKANFGFVCKYAKGGETPQGQTQFQVRNTNLKFHSDGYEWLVLSAGKAQFKGCGSVNGAPGYQFLVTTTDGRLDGSNEPGRFRIKIWNAQGVVYDSGLGAPDDLAISEPQPISQGNIAIR